MSITNDLAKWAAAGSNASFFVVNSTAMSYGTTLNNLSSSSKALTLNSGTASDYIALEFATSGTLRGYINATNGAMYISSSSTNPMVFYTNGFERMRIDSSGNVGIATNAPGAPLEVNGYIYSGNHKINRQDTGSEGGQIELCAANNNAIAWYFDAYGSTTTPALRIFNASAAGVTLVSGATSWTTMSDINLKTDLQPIENAVDTLKDIRCVTYHLKNIDEPDSKRRIGIIAQDIVGKVDEALDHAQMKNDPTDYLSVRYTELVPHLIKAIQELSTKNDELQERLSILEANK